jgi:hypothetical protein
VEELFAQVARTAGLLVESMAVLVVTYLEQDLEKAEQGVHEA